MGKIAVIAPAKPDGRRWHAVEKREGMALGVPFLEIHMAEGRRGMRAVRRILRRQAATAAVARRGVPQAVSNGLRECGCALYDGKRLLHQLYPRIIKALCKTKGLDMEQANFVVYADSLDDVTRQLVLDTAEQVRFLSLVTADAAAESFAALVLEQTGLALALGDGGRRADVALAAGGHYRMGKETINFTSTEIAGAIGDITLGISDFPPVDLALAEAIFTEHPQVWKQYERSVKILAFC